MSGKSRDSVRRRAAPSCFYAKIDDRGRIYLPKGLRGRSIGFGVDVRKRIIYVLEEGQYSADSRGRVFVPADIRRSLGIAPGFLVKFVGRGLR